MCLCREETISDRARAKKKKDKQEELLYFLLALLPRLFAVNMVARQETFSIRAKVNESGTDNLILQFVVSFMSSLFRQCFFFSLCTFI